MWLEVVYNPTTLFSLRQSQATSTGAKSLLIPSPYSVKMALLNAIITNDSVEAAVSNFELIKKLDMRFSLPEKIVVNNCLFKIRKEPHSNTKEKNPEKNFTSTVGFREYVFFFGNIKIAFNLDFLIKDQIEFLRKWFPTINYFGKKDCFFQFRAFREKEKLSNEYSVLIGDKFKISSSGLIVVMDDFDDSVTFRDVSTYSIKTKRNKKIRKEQFYVLPVKVAKSSGNYTLYVKV